MPKLSQLSETYPALGRVTLSPVHFNAAWPTRPKEEFIAGLRLLSSNDKIFVQVEAKRRADSLGKEDADSHAAIKQDALVRLVVARCLCDLNNANQPCSALPFAEDMVFDALTDSGAAHVFDEFLRLQVENATGGEGTIGDAARLFELIQGGVLETLSDARYQTVLRYLSFALSVIDDELTTA
jgi:hypothetical protein